MSAVSLPTPVAGQPPAETEYWQLVRVTLKKIFGKIPTLADNLEREVRGLPPEEKFSFYHAEPLDIASDLADQRPDANQVSDYLELRRIALTVAGRPSKAEWQTWNRLLAS